MNKQGPILILEDDEDDQEFFNIAYRKLDYTNQLMFFPDGNSALEFLNDSDITPADSDMKLKFHSSASIAANHLLAAVFPASF
ncbi:MAG: hypothetical protein ABIQ11_01240 [Saprospiraceae bacterium]